MGMWIFGGDNSSTAATGVPHITVENIANQFSLVMEWGFGGEVTASTLMRGGSSRAAEGVGARTAVTPGIYNEGATASSTFLSSTFNTTQPAIEGGYMWERSWNAHGGVVRWLAAPGQEISLLGVSTVILENTVGAALANYGFVWGEY